MSITTDTISSRFDSRSRHAIVMFANLNIADIISTVEFDHTGNYLATGDKGGRVVLFERNETVSVLCPDVTTIIT